ncbi:hypothetical protein WG66_004412 [Moniliophthora roreri]|uniref:Uncharacterized protein n=1 Tax=Moniliophthora roreri TaxID=221103 RepID=A0A0W0FBN7_MONRR|nr:hypothetical protein WG66_004412 [Moniliophthora roreri]
MPSIEPISSQAQSTLRRRMHVLENAHKQASRREETQTEETVLSHTDYESASGSDSSGEHIEEEENHEEDVEVDREQPSLHRSVSEEHERRRTEPIPSHSLPDDSAWYKFDLTVVAALVSPIGNWLTGGDHIKNVLLVLLLLFYLHQVIEVPWSLYHKARPRQRPPHIQSTHTSTEERYRELAASELQRIEILFLLFTILSPFIGALLIRIVSTTVLGEDTFSWFSIGLFVLATGVRPWSHLVQRISSRVTDLHDIIHYPSHHPSSNGDFRSELEALRKQVRQLDAQLVQLQRKTEKDSDEMYEYMDDAIDVVEKSIKRQEKKHEKQDGRFKDLEVLIDGLKKRNARPKLAPVSPSMDRPLSLPLSDRVSLVMTSFLPSWALPSLPRTSTQDGRYSPSSTVTRYSVPSPSSPDGLETIVEESDAPPPPEEAPAPQLNLPAKVFLRVGYVATLPLRSVSRMVFGYSLLP